MHLPALAAQHQPRAVGVERDAVDGCRDVADRGDALAIGDLIDANFREVACDGN